MCSSSGPLSTRYFIDVPHVAMWRIRLLCIQLQASEDFQKVPQFHDYASVVQFSAAVSPKSTVRITFTESVEHFQEGA